MTARTEQGDPVRAAQADALGAVVMSKAGEEAWRTGTVVEVLAPAPPTFAYDGRMPCTCTTLSFKVEGRARPSMTVLTVWHRYAIVRNVVIIGALVLALWLGVTYANGANGVSNGTGCMSCF